MAVTEDDIALLTRLVGRFENSGDPYAGVTGNFDGQGISCGVLQWNIGQGSLQPMVLAVGEAAVLATMPEFGKAMWRACNAALGKGMEIVTGWQDGTKLRAGPRRELQQLMLHPSMRVQQDNRIRKLAERAETEANAWAAKRGGGPRTRQELVLYFDFLTQNGGMKGVDFDDVQAFKTIANPGKIDDLICDWLAGLNQNFWGYKDAHKNADLWRDKVVGSALDLLVLAYLRSQKSSLKARGDVLNRKGTIAVRHGNVHGKLYDFKDLL